MDSRLIFESNKTFISNVNWLRPSDKAESEWVHFGTGVNRNIVLIQRTIDEHFKDDVLHISLTRNDSLSISKNDIYSSIVTLLKTDTQDFQVWDNDFLKVVEFNKIGIFRKGIR